MNRLVIAAIVLGAFAPLPRAVAADTEVDLQLVLAVDVSRSMDAEEQRVQRDGYAAAFRNSEVITAIQSGAVGRIAVTYFEWAGPEFQMPVVPWTVIGSAAEAEGFAARLAAAPIGHATRTSISSGLIFGAGLFNGSGFVSDRRTIDVSGDGPNNAGPPVDATRDQVVRQGITINGLPIVLRPSYSAGPFGIPNLDIYYKDCVIGGPGAFMIAITDTANFETAIRRKLVNEIAGLPVRVVPAADAIVPPASTDCQIGEKTRGGYDYGFH